jgi:hypothetical protein
MHKVFKRLMDIAIRNSMISGKDYRFIPLSAVLLLGLLFFLSESILGSYAILGEYMAIYPVPYFLDLKILLCAIDAIRNGSSPYVIGCITYANKIPMFNYPFVWGAFSILPFMTEANLIFIGICMAILFYASLYFFIGRCSRFSAVIYTLLFVSPAVILALERGNSDVIIFLLLMFAVFNYRSRYLFSILLLFTGMLKLYPLGSFVAILHTNQQRFRGAVLIFSLALASFIAYIIIQRENILTVSDKTPRPYGSQAYGLGEIPVAVSTFLDVSQGLARLPFYLFFAAATLAAYYYFIFRKSEIPSVQSGRHGIGYLIGSGIFILTCLIGFNFEYRLIFILFTVPQLLTWVYLRNRLAFAMLLCSILVVWQSLIELCLASLHLRSLHYHYTISQLIVVFLCYSHLTIVCRGIYAAIMDYSRKRL